MTAAGEAETGCRRDTGRLAASACFLPAPNIHIYIRSIEESAGDQMWVMESNIDDCTGEMLGFAMEMILAAGAADVWATPIFMKKNRPAYMVSVLCREDKVEELETLVLTQTTTIGVRRYPVSRTIMDRRNETVSTRFGDAQVKVCGYKGKQYFYPEYESVKTICREHGVDFRTAYDEIDRIAEGISGDCKKYSGVDCGLGCAENRHGICGGIYHGRTGKTGEGRAPAGFAALDGAQHRVRQLLAVDASERFWAHQRNV